MTEKEIRELKEQVPQWISVKERLPGEERVVFGLDEDE